MGAGRRANIWMLAVFCVMTLLDAVRSSLYLRSLLYRGYHLHHWYMAVFAIHLLSCPLLCFATWFLGQEQQAFKTRGLLWSLAFLMWAVSKGVWFWHVSIVDCLIVAFALGQFWSCLKPATDNPTPGDLEESQPRAS